MRGAGNTSDVGKSVAVDKSGDSSVNVSKKGNDVRKLKKWLVDDDNDDVPPSQPSSRASPPKSKITAKEEDDVGLGQILLNRLYSSQQAQASESPNGIKKTISRRAKSILHHKDVESDEEDAQQPKGSRPAGSVKAVVNGDKALVQKGTGVEARPKKVPESQPKKAPVAEQAQPIAKGNVSKSFDRSMLFQHLSDSDDSGEEISRTFVQNATKGSPEIDKGSRSLTQFRRQQSDLDDSLEDARDWVGISRARTANGGRVDAAKSRVEQFLRGSPRKTDGPSRSQVLHAEPTIKEDARGASEKGSTQKDASAGKTLPLSMERKTKTVAEIAAAMREREKEKKNTKELESRDSLKQDRVVVPVVRAGSSPGMSVTAELIQAPAALSAKVSANLKGKIVLLGAEGGRGSDLIRPTAAVGAAALVVVCGEEHPQVPKGRDVRIPVVGVSSRHAGMLVAGKMCTLNLEGAAGAQPHRGSKQTSRESSRQTSPRPGEIASGRGSDSHSPQASWKAAADVLRQPVAGLGKRGEGETFILRKVSPPRGSPSKSSPRSPPSPPRSVNSSQNGRKGSGIERGKALWQDDDSDSDGEGWRQKMARQSLHSRPADTSARIMKLSPSGRRAGSDDAVLVGKETKSPEIGKETKGPSGGALNVAADGNMRRGEEVEMTQGMREVLEWRLWGDERIPDTSAITAERYTSHPPNVIGVEDDGGSELSKDRMDVRRPVDTSPSRVEGGLPPLPPSAEKKLFFVWVDHALGRKPELLALERARDSALSNVEEAVTYTSETNGVFLAPPERADRVLVDWSGDFSRLSVEDNMLKMEPENGYAFHQSLEKKTQLREEEPQAPAQTSLFASPPKNSASVALPGSASVRDTPQAAPAEPPSVKPTVRHQNASRTPPGQASANETSYLGDSSDFSWRRENSRPTMSPDSPLPPPPGMIDTSALRPVAEAYGDKLGSVRSEERAQPRDTDVRTSQEPLSNGDSSKAPSSPPFILSEADRELCNKLLERDPAYMAAYVAKLGAGSLNKQPADRIGLLNHLADRLKILFCSSPWRLRSQSAARLRELCRHKSSESARQLVSSLAREQAVIESLVGLLVSDHDDGDNPDSVLQARVSAAACFRHLALDEGTFRNLQYTDLAFLESLGRALLKEGNQNVLQMTAAAVANLSVDSHSNRGTICSFASILAGLNRILESQDVACQESALAAYWNLSLDVDQVQAILSHLSLTKLSAALQSGTPRSQHRASGLVRNLLLWPGSRKHIASEPTIHKALLQLKAKGSSETAQRAEMALDLLETRPQDQNDKESNEPVTPADSHQALKILGSALKVPGSVGRKTQDGVGAGVVDGGLGGPQMRRGEHGRILPDRIDGVQQREGQVHLDDSTSELSLGGWGDVSRSQAQAQTQAWVEAQRDASIAMHQPIIRRSGSHQSVSEAGHGHEHEEWVLVVRLVEAKVLTATQHHDESRSPGGLDESAPSPSSDSSPTRVFGYFVVSVDAPPHPAIFSKSSREQARDGTLEWKHAVNLHLPTAQGVNCVVRISLRIQSSSGTSIADARPIPLLPMLPLIQTTPTELPLLAISRKDRRTPLASARLVLFLQPPRPALSPMSSPSPSIRQRLHADYPAPLPAFGFNDQTRALPVPVSRISKHRDDDKVVIPVEQQMGRDSANGESKKAKEDKRMKGEDANTANSTFGEQSSLGENIEDLSVISVHVGRTVLTASPFAPVMVLAGMEEGANIDGGDTTEPTISELRDEEESAHGGRLVCGREDANGESGRDAEDTTEPTLSELRAERTRAEEQRKEQEDEERWKQVEEMRMAAKEEERRRAAKEEERRRDAEERRRDEEERRMAAKEEERRRDADERRKEEEANKEEEERRRKQKGQDSAASRGVHDAGHDSGVVPAEESPVSPDVSDKSVQEKRNFWKQLEGTRPPVQDRQELETASPQRSQSNPKRGNTTPPLTTQTKTATGTSSSLEPQDGLQHQDTRMREPSADIEFSLSSDDAASPLPIDDALGNQDTINLSDLAGASIKANNAISPSKMDASVETDNAFDAMEVASTTSTERREMGVQCQPVAEMGTATEDTTETDRDMLAGMDDLVGMLESSMSNWQHGDVTLERAKRLMPRLCRLLKQLHRFERTRGALVAEAEGQADEAVLQQLGLDSSIAVGASRNVTLVKVLRLIRDLCKMSPGCLEALQQDNSIANTLLRILRPRSAKAGASAGASANLSRSSKGGIGASGLDSPAPSNVSAMSTHPDADPERKMLAADLLAKFAIRNEDNGAPPHAGRVSKLLAKVQDQWWSGLPR